MLAQQPAIETKSDSISKKDAKKESPFSTGYYPVGVFDIDLKTLIKYNNYEGFRLGIGGLTNDRLFKKYRVGGYVAYGFKDRAVKFSYRWAVPVSIKRKKPG